MFSWLEFLNTLQHFFDIGYIADRIEVNNATRQAIIDAVPAINQNHENHWFRMLYLKTDFGTITVETMDEPGDGEIYFHLIPFPTR